MEKTHYYDKNPETPSKINKIQTRISGLDFVFETDSGVFSKNAIDFGSNLLLETVIDELKAKKRNLLSILDLGCGYGPVGIVLKRIFPEITINMTDINERALALASRNAINNHVKFANIFASDAHEGVEASYDVILTNPPVRAGKKTVFRFYENSFQILNPGGALYVVIQKKQGAPSSEEKLKQVFGNCEIIGKKAGYRILKSIKNYI